jgi:hypothetical protein
MSVIINAYRKLKTMDDKRLRTDMVRILKKS